MVSIMILTIISELKQSDSNGLLVKPDKNILTGFSGTKVIGTLQRLASLLNSGENNCYVEVGVFQGLSLLSVALSCPTIPCYGIDNFAYFDPEKKNYGLVQERKEKLGLKNVNIINKDYEEALEKLETDIGNKKIGLYFIDGPHDYRSQTMCLRLALPYLSENAIIVIDDCNYRHVRQANRDFLITNPEFKLIFEAYSRCHPSNLPPGEFDEVSEGWWNGINVLVRDVNNELMTMLPPTERNRQLYENEHVIHAANVADFAVEGVTLLQSLYDLKIVRALNKVVRLMLDLNKHKKLKKNLYKNMNTYSETLPKIHYNKLREL
jgi:predicted O-methyltransferase YrrM